MKSSIFLSLLLIPQLAVGQVFLVSETRPTRAPQQCQCSIGGECTCGDDCQCEKPVQLVSVVKRAKAEAKVSFADIANRPKSLGFGTPETRAPLPDDLLKLVALKDQVTLAPIDTDHQPLVAARTTTRPDPLSAPPSQYRAPVYGRSYTYGYTDFGSGCSGSSCSASYGYRSGSCAGGSCAGYSGRRFGWFRRR